MAERRLHAVGTSEASDPRDLDAARARGRLPAMLGTALALVLLLLVVTWIRLGNRVASLEGEVAALGAAVAERDRTIEGQARRLSDIRDRLDDLGRRVAEARAAIEAPAGN